MYSDIVNTGLSVINKATDWLRRGGGSDSLVSFTQVGRVEPLCLIDQAALHLPEIGDVQQSMLACFAGYYLQAASLSNVIGTVRVIDRLDALNPNRSPETTALNRIFMASESIDDINENGWMRSQAAYTNGLPFLSDKKAKLATESHIYSAPALSTEAAAGPIPVRPDAEPRVGSLLGSKVDTGRTLQELVNLSIGRQYEINITDGKNSYPVMVNIRLIASMLSTKDMIHILATGSDDTSWKERWHGWRSGRLAFWKDLVFCNDLIDKHRQDLMRDSSGTLGAIGNTTTRNQMSSLITGQPSIASSSNIAVITKETADSLELQLEGKLIKYDIRQRMMKKTALMLLAVIDTDYQTLTIYSRNIALPTTVRLKDLKASNKGSGPDIGEILKQLMGGHPPSL